MEESRYAGNPSQDQSGHDHYATDKSGINREDDDSYYGKLGGNFYDRSGAGTAVFVVFAVRNGFKPVYAVESVHGGHPILERTGQINVNLMPNVPPVNIRSVDGHDFALEVVPGCVIQIPVWSEPDSE